MPSRRKLEDLEYNVFRKHTESGSAGNDGEFHDAGCLTILAGIIVTVIVLVAIVGFMQIGRNGPSAHCAAPGCSNRPKPGGNYCWLHSSSYSSRGGGKDIEPAAPSTDSSKSDDTKSNKKIWEGSTGRKEAPQSGSMIN